jgi:hypothetical protein
MVANEIIARRAHELTVCCASCGSLGEVSDVCKTPIASCGHPTAVQAYTKTNRLARAIDMILHHMHQGMLSICQAKSVPQPDPWLFHTCVLCSLAAQHIACQASHCFSQQHYCSSMLRISIQFSSN